MAVKPERRYNVVFSGKLVEGSKPPEVLAHLCTLLEQDEQAVRALFKGGAGVVIREGVEAQVAYRLREELTEAGVVSSVQEVVVVPEELPGDIGLMPGVAAPRRPPEQGATAAQRPQPANRPAPAAQGSGSGIGGLLVKVVLLAAMGGGGWWIYTTYFAPPSPAFAAYTQFADALAREQYQKAADVSSGQARGYVDQLTQMMAPSSMKVYGKEFTLSKPSISSIAGEVAWIKYKRKGEKKGESGTVTLQVEETVCRIPPGVSSAICKWPVEFLHEVEVSQEDGAWKVSSFKEERLTPQQ
jgi:hypothetical protein